MGYIYQDGDGSRMTLAELRKTRADIRREALEEAAKAVENFDHTNFLHAEPEDYAAAIRALISPA